MITRSRLMTVLRLALPITAGLGASLIMNVVDLAMVGSLGKEAVAAVGLAGFGFALVSAFIAGISPTVQGIVARRTGQGSKEPKCLPLNAALILTFVLGIPITIVCYALTPLYFEAISPDPKVAEQGIPYMRALLISMTPLGMAAAFSGYWMGLGRTKVYMANVLFSNILHVFLNYMLIFGHFGAPALGVTGAGIATALSVLAGMLLYAARTFFTYRSEGFLTLLPDRVLVGRIVQFGLPAMLEAAVFALGFIALYWIVARVGTAELAAENVLVRISLLFLLFAQALGMASATLVSKSLGEGDPEGAARWGWDVAKIALVWISALGLPLVFFPSWFLKIFLSDPATIELAIIPLQLTGAFTGVVGIIYIFSTTLVSVGDAKRVLLVSVISQWVFFMPAVWFVAMILEGGLLGISLVETAYGVVAAALMTAMWSGGRWKSIRV